MAIGDTLCAWDAAAARPPLTNYATLDVRNNHVVLDFDDSTDESAFFEGLLPAHYDGGDLEVVLTWSVENGDSGATVTWEAAYERHRLDGAFDLETEDFGSDASVTTAAHASDNIPRQSTATIAGSAADDPAAGESFRLRIRRDNAAGTNIPEDAELMRVEVKEA